jgi:cytochrome c biogenesis protein CcdA
MIAALTGLIAGFVHVLAGPDHLTAVAPLAAEDRRYAWSSGLRWGIGHSAGVAVIGVLSLMLRNVLPLDLISDWSERLVGLVLIAIGFWSLRRALLVHSHQHEHEGEMHEHVHLHGRRETHGENHSHTHAAFGIGALHGVAGSSHFLGVLPALAFATNLQAIAYLAAYALGTIVAMAGFAAVIGLLAERFAVGRGRAYRGLMYACSAAAFLVGSSWLIM